MKHLSHAECDTIHPSTIVNNYYSVSSHKHCRHAVWNYKVGMPMLKCSKENNAMLELACTNEEKVHVTLSPVTPGGKPIAIENFNVSVQSGDGTFEIDPDGAFGFWVISGGAAGDTAYAINADADLGAGVQNVADFITLRVHGAMAAALGMAADAPVLK